MNAFGWAILAAVCWGFAPVAEKLGLRGSADPVAGVFIRSIGVMIGAAGFLAFTPRLFERLEAFSASHWGYLLFGGVMASILGQICFYRALKLGDVSQVAPIGASYPVLAFILGVIFLNEPLTYAKACGIALVITGVYLLR